MFEHYTGRVASRPGFFRRLFAVRRQDKTWTGCSSRL